MRAEDRDTLVRILSTESTRAVGIANAGEKARMDERLARAELLTVLVDTLRPALRRLAGRVAVAGRRIAGENQTDPAPWRGLLVHRQPADRLLYIDAEGGFVLLEIEEGDGWRSEQTRLSPVQVVDRYDLPVLIVNLALVVEQTQAMREEKTIIDRAVTERLRALAKLVSA